MILPAVSINQPWPYAILYLGKDVENRTWNFPRKYLGKTVLMHASLAFDHNGYRWLVERGYSLPVCEHDFPTGGIVGSMTFSRNIVPGPRSPWAEPGRHWWPIASARPLKFFPCKGKLGFFIVDYPYEVAS
jgi:hypothetical protein